MNHNVIKCSSKLLNKNREIVFKVFMNKRLSSTRSRRRKLINLSHRYCHLKGVFETGAKERSPKKITHCPRTPLTFSLPAFNLSYLSETSCINLVKVT